jgi:hypothetical protein
MTVHPKLNADVAKEFTPCRHDSGVVCDHCIFVEDPNIEILPPYTDGRPEVVICDGPDFLYQDFATLNDLVLLIRSWIEFQLNKPNVAGVIFGMDRGTPAPKAANRQTDDKGNTPKTPFDEFGVSDARVAWKKYFDHHCSNPNAVSSSLSELNGTAHSYNRYIRPPNFPDFLKNRAFKEFFSDIVLAAVYRSVKIPAGRWFVAIGAFDYAKKRNAHAEMPLDEFYKRPYLEMDYETVHLANNLHRQYHVTIYSRDGDVWLANLLSQTRRIVDLGDGSVDAIDFGGQVIVVRQWRKRGKFAYVRIAHLWRAIYNHALALEKCITVQPGFRFESPVATYVFLMLLFKNDYVTGFPILTPERVLTAVRVKLGMIGLPLLEGAQSAETLRIDCSAVLRVLLYAYELKYPKLAIDVFDIDTSMHNVQKQLGSFAGGFTISTVKVAIANAYWFMQYMIKAQTGNVPETGLETAKLGDKRISKYGYLEESPVEMNKNYTGVPNVVRPMDVAWQHLRMNRDCEADA